MSDRPLSDKMRRVLLAIYLRAGRNEMPPNDIAYACGYVPTMAKRGNSGRGNSTRVMGVAVHVTTALTALERRGLVYVDHRPDGLSGTAYGLTWAGLAEARQAGADGLDTNAAKAEGKKTERQRDAALMAKLAGRG